MTKKKKPHEISPEDFDMLHDGGLQPNDINWLTGSFGDEGKKTSNSFYATYINLQRIKENNPGPELTKLYLQLMKEEIYEEVLPDPESFKKSLKKLDELDSLIDVIDCAKISRTSKKTQMERLNKQVNSVIDNFLNEQFDMKVGKELGK